MKKQNKKQFLEILQPMLRPLGAGIPIVSAGKGAEFYIQKKYFSCLGSNIETSDEVTNLWQKSLKDLIAGKIKPEVIVLGVPLDTGAGIRRGAAYGPRAIRDALLDREDYKTLIKSGKVFDLGDVYVNPHLLHDEMLNKKQISLSQKEMYKDSTPAIQKKLPVSALSQLELVCKLLLEINGDFKIYLLGGDHSVAWPLSKTLIQKHKGSIAIIQPDAHTDMLASRLGVKYCFGTWSYHANELLKRSGRMVQVGIRQSGRDKKHWEKFGIKQYWAHEIVGKPPKKIIDDMVIYLKSKKVTKIYFSNDIDGTDMSEAPATGTPCGDGVSSSFFMALIDALGYHFDLVAADIVEVAPDLSDLKGQELTRELAADYSLACLKQMIKEHS